MPRYFFDLILKSSAVRRDHAGTELPDVDSARRLALGRLAEAAEGSPSELIAIEVRDARSELLARLSVVAHEPWPGVLPEGHDLEVERAAWLEDADQTATHPADPVERLRGAKPPGMAGAIAEGAGGVGASVNLPLYGIVKADGLRWTVVDLETGSTARYDLKQLIQLSREEAEAFADRLNFRAQSRAQLLGDRSAG